MSFSVRDSRPKERSRQGRGIVGVNDSRSWRLYDEEIKFKTMYGRKVYSRGGWKKVIRSTCGL